MYAAGQAKNLQVFFYCSDALFGAVVFIVDKYNKEKRDSERGTAVFRWSMFQT